jgi:hypothetical protein
MRVPWCPLLCSNITIAGFIMPQTAIAGAPLAPFHIGGFMANTTAQITWLHDLDAALQEAGQRDRHVLLDFSAAPL